jgi:hypothetical protein
MTQFVLISVHRQPIGFDQFEGKSPEAPQKAVHAVR